MKNPWYEVYADRYREELKALEDLDIECSVDRKALAEKAVVFHLKLNGDNKHLSLDRPGQEFLLDVAFPDSYPWFRPEIYAYDLNLPRHQHLIAKNLCLLPRGTRHWD